jgi:hypothetical protein
MNERVYACYQFKTTLSQSTKSNRISLAHMKTSTSTEKHVHTRASLVQTTLKQRRDIHSSHVLCFLQTSGPLVFTLYPQKPQPKLAAMITRLDTHVSSLSPERGPLEYVCAAATPRFSTRAKATEELNYGCDKVVKVSRTTCAKQSIPLCKCWGTLD